MDGWSDLDLEVRLASDIDVRELVPVPIWAVENVSRVDGQVCRTVLSDGTRLDLSVAGPGKVVRFDPAPDNDIRFLAAIATTKLGRGDRLIGLHLTLELWKRCLEQAMLLRDRDTGTTIHRHGTGRDQLADQIHKLAAMRTELTPRPTVIERTVELWGGWLAEHDAEYRPDWRPLCLLTDRGLAGGTWPNAVESDGSVGSYRP